VGSLFCEEMIQYHRSQLATSTWAPDNVKGIVWVVFRRYTGSRGFSL